ncbi:hypothetical protein HHI36_000341, partial [Cryptolaemus montrouzieri]
GDNYFPLQIISQDSFEMILTKKSEEKPIIIVFLEETLSPEDFSLRSDDGSTVFPTLSTFVDLFKVSYLPYAENPVESIQKIPKSFRNIDEMAVFRNSSLYLNEVIIFSLNDSRNNETRKDMFSRHDCTIFRLHSLLLQLQENILAIYTARHEMRSSVQHLSYHRSKKLLQAMSKAKPPIISDKNLLIVSSKDTTYSTNNGLSFISVSLSQTNFSINNKSITFILEGNNVTVMFSILFDSGYWKIPEVTLNGDKTIFEKVEVPLKFSYHCTNFILKKKDNKTILIFPGFQIQPFEVGSNEPKFGPAYDCTGYVTIPILNGLFISAILLIILFYGLISMMNIETMDRFDDPSKKPFHAIVES